MAHGFKHGGGGAGAGLNFKIVGGTTEPANPSENMIWVNTDAEITEWVISAINPLAKYTTVTDLLSGITFANGYFTSEGVLTSSDNDRYTIEYIPVRYGKKYEFTCSNPSPVSLCLGVVEYDNNQNVIGMVDLFNVTSSAYQSNVYTPSTSNVALIRFFHRHVSATTTLTTTEIVLEEDKNGMVWIRTGASSNTEFNALKKNSISVFPLSAHQYFDGMLIDKTAKIYQDGEWVDWWNGELYDNGNEFETQTGGWKLGGGSGFTKNADHMNLVNRGESYGCVICTSNKIDLSGYSILNVEYEKTSGNNFGVSVIENTNQDLTFTDFWDNALAVKTETQASGITSLDISGVNRPCYIAIGGADWSAFTVNILKVWLE